MILHYHHATCAECCYYIELFVCLVLNSSTQIPRKKERYGCVCCGVLYCVCFIVFTICVSCNLLATSCPLAPSSSPFLVSVVSASVCVCVHSVSVFSFPVLNPFFLSALFTIFFKQCLQSGQKIRLPVFLS